MCSRRPSPACSAAARCINCGSRLRIADHGMQHRQSVISTPDNSKCHEAHFRTAPSSLLPPGSHQPRLADPVLFRAAWRRSKGVRPRWPAVSDRLFNGVGRQISNVLDHGRDLAHACAPATSNLQTQVDTLTIDNLRLKEVEAENARLRELLRFAPAQPDLRFPRRPGHRTRDQPGRHQLPVHHHH